MNARGEPGQAAELEKLARYYDLRHGAFEADIDFYRDLARDQDLVLELGCGTGRLLAPLADEAHLVVGLERSEAMLSRARARLKASGLGRQVPLVRADLRQCVCRGASLAVVALNTFSHFTDRTDQRRVLEAARAGLAEGGVLVLDVPNPHREMDARPANVMVLEQTTETAEGTMLEWSVAEVERAAQRLRIRCLYDLCRPDGLRRDSCLVELYLYYRPELELLLERAGFQMEGTYGDYDYTEYGEDSPRLVVLARAN